MVFPYEYYKRQNDTISSGSGEPSDRDERDGKRLCAFRSQWIIWRMISGVMGFFFFAATYVQYNDPDPYIWMLVYIIPCIVSWAVALGLTVKEYTRVPNASESSSSTTDSGTLDKMTEYPLKLHKLPSEKGTPRVEGEIVIPMYGSTNTKLNWLINIHIIYCFALGIWTLVVSLHRMHAENREKTPTTRVFNRALRMEDGTEEAKELMGLCLVIAWLSLLQHNNYVLLGRLGITTAALLTVTPLIAWTCVEMFEAAETDCF